MIKIDSKEFEHTVYEIVCLIPKGRATSYGAIAKAIGYPNLSRMVGKTLAHASEMKIPVHRVVNSKGILSGREAFKHPTTQQSLLEAEDVIVRNNKIQNWRSVFWDPMIELHL